MSKRGTLKLWMAVATLVGTIVGAGILGIPYVVAKAGFLYGFLIMLLLGIIFIFLHLFTGEVVLRTKTQHQLTGYAEKYLGINGKRIMLFTMLFGIYGALTAYLIGEGAALHSMLNLGTPLLYTVLFFLPGFFIVYRGIKTTGRTELILILFLVAVVAIIGVFSFKHMNWSNFTAVDLRQLFLPYGVILFAFAGSTAIPQVQEVLGRDKRLMKKAIIIGAIIPIVLYIVFTIVIMGLVGLEQFEALQPNERIATIALSFYTHPFLGLLANLMALLSMFTSFLALGLALTEAYQFDYGFSRNAALGLTFAVPFLLAVFNLTTFITVLGVTGSIAGGLDGILITLMYWKAKETGDRKPEYSLPRHHLIGGIIIAVFTLGLLYQLWVNVV